MANEAQRIDQLQARLDRLESQMAFVFRQMGLSAADMPRWEASPNVLELVRKGDTNGAIRAFREESGASLKDAKAYIDSLRT